MILNHINLVVTDVKEAINLFERHFGFTCVDVKGDNIVAILKGEDGFTLVLMPSKDGDTKFPAAFHIGFMQSSIEAVTDTYHALKSNGLNVGDEPRKIRDSFGFYFVFDNLMIEVGYYI